MKLTNYTCSICGKPKGRPYNHSACAKKLQKLNTDVERKKRKIGENEMQLIEMWKAARARRKLAKAIKIVAAAGMYPVYIKVVAGTHYPVRPDGMMYKIGKPIEVQNGKA